MKMAQDIRNAKILIVDDDAMSVRLIEESLNMGGFMAHTYTSDPRKAKALFESYKPDIVLLDLNMPHISGFDVMESFKETDPTHLVPIVVLTAHDDIGVRLKALDMGAMDFIPKPFNHAEVVTRVRNIITVRLLQKQVMDQNTLLEQKVLERTAELHDTRLEIIRHLGRAVEYRDDETGLHIVRMSQMCALMGKAYGMNDENVDLLLNAAPMHDVGKIGISDTILLKPGRLNDEERAVMQTHAAIGAKILSGHDSPIMNMARDIALAHHERWDGQGYPNRLRGEEIPLVGRISALCDVFDALLSTRPYKDAWTMEAAISEVVRLKGAHFDPELTDLFLSILPEIKVMRDCLDGGDIKK